MSIVRGKRKMRDQIGDIDIFYLENGTAEGGPPHDDFELFLRTDEEWKGLWEELRDKIMEAWKKEHPCTRPWGFWQYDVKEPRLRIGGTGTPSHEVLAISSCFEFGIPTAWITDFDERHFENCKGKAIDWSDPPTFESQGVYLQRHGLLTDAEKKFIEKHPELLEPEVIREND